MKSYVLNYQELGQFTNPPNVHIIRPGRGKRKSPKVNKDLVPADKDDDTNDLDTFKRSEGDVFLLENQEPN